MTRHPRRPRRQEPLVIPTATPEQSAATHALAPFDRAATDMDRKWGIDRLPSLVSPELAARWGRAMAKLNAAIASEDPAQVVEHASAGIRGLQVMDAEAEASGATKTPEIWEHDDGQGLRFGIIPDAYQWQAAKKARPDLMLFSITEVCQAIKGIDSGVLLGEVKKRWPGAQVMDVHRSDIPDLPPGFIESGGDPIPFGQEKDA